MPAKRKRARRKQLPEYETHYLNVQEWDASYSFGLNRTKRLFPGPYSEYTYLQIKGEITTEEFKYNTQYEMMVLGDPSLDDHEKRDETNLRKPVAVGNIYAKHDAAAQIIISIPFRAILLILPLFMSDKIQEIFLQTYRMKWKQAQILYYHFSTTIDEERI